MKLIKILVFMVCTPALVYSNIILDIIVKTLPVLIDVSPYYSEVQTALEETGEIACSTHSHPGEGWQKVHPVQTLLMFDPGQARNDGDPDFYRIYDIPPNSDVYIKCSTLSGRGLGNTAGYIDEANEQLHLNVGTLFMGNLHNASVYIK